MLALGIVCVAVGHDSSFNLFHRVINRDVHHSQKYKNRQRVWTIEIDENHT